VNRNKSSAVAEMGDRLATEHSRKVGDVPFPGSRAGNGSMGQMGHENRMGHMGHGSLGVDP